MIDDKQDLGTYKLQEEKELETMGTNPALTDPVWDVCRFTQRIVHPYSTFDFKREYFIPDL